MDKFLIFFKKYLSLLGASILLLYAGQRLHRFEKDYCPTNNSLTNKLVCLPANINKKIYLETDNIVKFLINFKSQGFDQAPRAIIYNTKDRFKNYSSGFDFGYEPEISNKRGYLLLSRIEPDLKVPRIELWDLSKQNLVHSWKFNIKEVYEKIKISKNDREVLRFLNPVLNEDGSIITHPQPENSNTELVKFDFCGNLIKKLGNGLRFHHAIEKYKENIYVPIGKMPSSRFYSNYKEFPINYRNEGIAILNEDLKIKELIPLDELFNSAGLLKYISTRNNYFKNDPYHLNDVQPYTDDNGDLNFLLSMRHFGLMSYNYSKNNINWISRGLTTYQHDMNLFLGNNKIFTVFDNGDVDNEPFNKFQGNTIVKIDFSKFKDFNKGTILFGDSPNIDNLMITRYDFTKLPNNLIPKTITEGRGEFISQTEIFIEETNQGRAFIYDIETGKIDWAYFNKGESSFASPLGWSRYLKEIPPIFREGKKCTN